MQSAKGFTIVELLIVIIVIAVLAAIAIVSYTGITNQARQSANMTSIDGYEKAVRLAKAENGIVPYAVQDNQRIAMYDEYFNNSDEAFAILSSSNPPTTPLYVELQIPGCLNGTYPASGIFRENECWVSQVHYDFIDSNYPDLTMRNSFILTDTLANEISPRYIGTIPKLSPDVYQRTYTFNNIPAAITSENETTVRNVNYSESLGSRGVTYQAATGSEGSMALMNYYVMGDHQCGRGNKTLLSIDELFAQLVDSYEGYGEIETNVTYNGQSQWTQCSILIQ